MKNLIWILLLAIPFTITAQEEAPNTSLSPYFMVKSSDTKVDALPLKSTGAEVNIAGVIADVMVTQTYINTGKKSLEAIYVFPASVNAAVYGLSMQIGQRCIYAKIAERNKARAAYEQAKNEGKRASLLEEERPNVFQMNVANIMPGDTIRVQLRYTELLVPENGQYEFVYPAVVGPRYSNGTSKNNNGFTAAPYTKDKQTSYDFFLNLHIAAGMPIHDIQSRTHKITVTDNGIAGANVLLDGTENKGGNRDFILRYSLQGESTSAGLLLYNDGKEQFFLCVAQPPKRVPKNEIPPREYVFVVDVSGSMNGFPLDVSKKLLCNLVKGLRPTDQFNIILFAGVSNMLAEKSLNATPENVEKAIAFIDRQEGSGGTELLPALKRALQLPKATKELSRSFIVVTDGYIDVEAESFDLVRNHLDEANLFAFGIGSGVNRHLIEGLAHVGAGMPFVVTNGEEGDRVAERFRRYIATPVFSNIKTRFPGWEVYDLEPSRTPDVFAERPVVLMGKYRGNAEGEIVIRGNAGRRKKEIRIPVSEAIPDDRNSAIKYIWAREKIKLLSDYNMTGQDPARDAKVTALGLQYNLLTAFTSFVAIDEVVANNGDRTKVNQPLPLPEGVSDLAVGFDLGIHGISGAAQGNTWKNAALLLFAGLFCWGIYRRRARGLKTFLVLGIAATGLLSSCQKQQETTWCDGNSIAFILGEDRSERNPYFASARQWFRTDSLEKTDFQVASCQTLQEVHKFLTHNRPIQGAWKTIHLVVHGNQWTGMRVPVQKGGERSTAALVNTAVDKGVFPALPEGHFDSNTTLIIDGCNIGQDSALLTALGRAFQGAQVSSPPYFNIFEANGENGYSQGVQHYLADSRYIVFPAGIYPGNRAVAKELATRYPNDTTNWSVALQQLRPRFPGEPYVHYFSIPVHWTTLYNSTQTTPTLLTDEDRLQWVKSQPELLREIQEMGLQPESFRWSTEVIDYPDGWLGGVRPAIAAEGMAMIYCVLKPLVEMVL